MATQIKLRRDTAVNWSIENPILAEGEPGLDTTNNILKIGNGTDAWTALPSIYDPSTNIVPAVDNTYDLGSPTKQWRHVYTAGGSIYLDNIKLTNVGGKFVATKVVNPGEENEAEDPEDSDATSEIGGGGGGIVERTVSFPLGQSGDTRGTIALTPEGETYVCTADWENSATGLQGTFTTVTVELYNIGQSGGIYNSAVLSIANSPEIYNIIRYGNWVDPQFTIDAGATWGGAQNVTSTSFNDQAGLMYIQWMVGPGDPQEIPLGTSITVVYNGGGTQLPIWKRLVDLTSDDGNYAAINWRNTGDLTIETLRPQGYTGDCDLNLDAADDVFITANGDEVNITANTNVVIESNNGNHAWTFAQNGSLQLPGLSNTGYQNGYSLNGPTLRLGGENDPNDQVIITGPEPDSNTANAQRLVIQGQRGYGIWGQPSAGEGGDVYIWGGVGGEGTDGLNNIGGSGGDIKIRGGQGQNNQGGYVKIEGGSAADWNGGSNTGGYIEISGGDALGGNGNGADVNIRGGRAYSGGSGNNGQVYIRTGITSEHEWMFDNGGSLSLPTNGRVGFNYGYVGQDTTIDNNALRLSGGVDVGIYTNEDAKRWLFKTDGKLELPVGGDIVDSSGNSVLSAGADTNVWVQTFASDTVGDNVTLASSVEYDPDGNVIALFSHDDTNDSERYISVAKFDTSGGKLWQQRFASGQYSDGWGLAADSTSIYVAGELDGAGSPAAYQVSSLMKLNTANGNVIWMKSFDFGEESYSQVVDVASDGNPVMVGYAYSGGQAFVTTTKLDKDTGNIIWSRKLDGQNGEYSYGMAVGPAGEIVVIGYMDNAGILNAAATLYSEPASNPNWTNGTGVFAGGVNFAVTFTDGVPNFTSVVDPVGGRTVDDVLGVVNGTGFGGSHPADDMTVKVGTVTPGDNSDKMLVVKYDSSGSIQWQKAIQFDAGYDCGGADADIDADGNIYVCGNYWFNNGGGTSQAMSLLKMDGNGTKIWSRRTVGDCQDLSTSVVVGPDNCVYLSGITGNAGASDYTFVIVKYTPLGSVVWQRLLDNTTTWTFGFSWFSQGGGSNIAVKNGYVTVSGQFGDPGDPTLQAFIAQISNAGSLFTVGDWDFKGASFSSLLNNTASDLTVTAAGKTDSDNAINITISSVTPATDASNFLVPTKYVLSTPIGDLTVLNNILRGTGDNSGGSGLYLAPGPNLNDMYFRIRGGDTPTHLHFDTGNNTTYDQYWGDDNKYLKLGADGNVTIRAWTSMSGGETWTFSTDKTTTIPGALIQGTVAATYTSTPLPLDLKFATNKLADGSYTLADGVEGQIMYLVPQTGVTPANVSVDVANFRTGGFASTNGLLYPFRIFNDANASYYDSRAFCTLIFTDGAWQQSGGSWD